MRPYLTEREIETAFRKIQNSEEAVFTLPGLVDVRLNFLSGFLFRLLSRFGIAYLTEMLLVVVREIAGNCSRAAGKRLFFEKKGLDIHSASDYEKGLALFRSEIQDSWSEFVDRHQKSKYFIKIFFQLEKEHLLVKIINNISLLDIEKKRIRKRLESFYKFENISDAFSSIGDTSEGAGLGIFFLLSLLKNSNIPPKNFRILPKKDKTIHELRIPLKPTSESFKSKFYDLVLKEIETLPALPDHINRLMELCDSPDSSVDSIAALIQQDAGLSVQVLKLVNSAGYMSRNRNPSLHDAVKIIGLKGLRDLLMVTGARHVIQDRYKIRQLNSVWNESNAISCLARKLAAKHHTAQLADQASVAGLLGSLGRIVLLSLHPKLMQQTLEMLQNRRIRNGSLLEEAMIGISNAEIGALMIQKWDFPPALVAAIRYQYQPLLAPKEYRELTECVYLAGLLYKTNRQLQNYWFGEPDILAHYAFSTPEQFQKKADYLASECQSES